MQEQSPPDPNGSSLHNRLLTADLTASAEIAETYLLGLVHYLQGKYPNLSDPHLAETAAIDAMISYLRKPRQYDPSRVSLEQFLRLAARADLLNLINQQRRKERGPKKLEVVELDAPGSEYTIEDESMLSVEEHALILASPLPQRLIELLPDSRDLEVVLLMMSDVRSTEEYAEALEIEHLPHDEQAAVVKRNKDRLKKWLQRHISRSELQDYD